jgi:hypothetical protein
MKTGNDKFSTSVRKLGFFTLARTQTSNKMKINPTDSGRMAIENPTEIPAKTELLRDLSLKNLIRK